VTASTTVDYLPFASSAHRAESKAKGQANWLLRFVLVQLGCQLVLLIPQIGPFRPICRVAAFGISIALLFFLPARGPLHPSARIAVAVLLILGVEFFHPLTNNLVAGAAQVLLYLAILAPLFWVRSCRLTLDRFRAALLLLWAFHVASSVVGILQVSFPGRLQANVTSAVTQMGSAYLSGLQMRTASGQLVYRPMGLTDTPGGAAVSGFFAILLSTVFALEARSGYKKVVFAIGLFPGIACLVLSQVRMYLVMAALCLGALYCVLLLRREAKRMLFLSVAISVTLVVGVTFAVAVGGASVTSRLKTLTEGSPSNVYYKSRGFLFDYTVREFAPAHPLGLGLGRWGMIYNYFGDGNNPEKSRLWAEIQWTAWVIDGGFPLVFAYVFAIATALATTVAIAFRGDRKSGIWLWAAFVTAYDLGAIAATFTSPFFISGEGMEFWALNAALYSVALSQKMAARTAKARSYLRDVAPEAVC
jgi:hypothetical protein